MTDMFTGKVALVTGGSAGIGRAAALLFARHDARVVVSDIASEAGQAVVEEIAAQGGEASYVDCDVSDRQSVKALVGAAVDRFGRLDCAFNNAGVFFDSDSEWDDLAFDRTVAINLNGVMHCMKAEIAQMIANGGGTIVNTSSTHGVIAGLPTKPGYTASKHAIIGLTRDAALAHALDNIRVNAICPGVTETQMMERFADLGPEVRARLANSSPMGRMGRPEEMAEAAIWLCSDKSSFVNGHALVIDGGMVIR